MTQPDLASQSADLTAKARIRNAALELFAAHGAPGASLREVAQRAGVTVGLITHHFGSKDALRVAVDEYVVEFYRVALADIPDGLPADDVVAQRNANVAQMLDSQPSIQQYLRRAYLEPPTGPDSVLEKLADLTLAEVRSLRASGIASRSRTEEWQTTQLIMSQLGELLLQPLADRVWRRVTGGSERGPKVSARLSD